jgi:hypothetical protein
MVWFSEILLRRANCLAALPSASRTLRGNSVLGGYSRDAMAAAMVL